LPGTGLSYRFEPISLGGFEQPAERRSTLRGVLEIFAAMFAVVAFVCGLLMRAGRLLAPHARVVASHVATKALAALR
jgi:hypothetical protein